MGQVAKDFDLTETAVWDWVRQAEVYAGERDGLTSDEREELAWLRRENRRLREDVDILEQPTTCLHRRPGDGPPPFIEAEKQAGHNVKRACEPLKVSRAALYARHSGEIGPRTVRKSELTSKIAEIQSGSNGSYGAPRSTPCSSRAVTGAAAAESPG